MTTETKIALSAGAYVIETAAIWAAKQFFANHAHHLSYKDIETLHKQFKPLLETDKEAIHCFARCRSIERSGDPQKDIVFPEYIEGTLHSAKLNCQATATLNRTLATLRRYLSNGLSMTRQKTYNRHGNYHEAVISGILTWLHCRFDKIVNQCMDHPEYIDAIFTALDQSLNLAMAHKGANKNLLFWENCAIL